MFSKLRLINFLDYVQNVPGLTTWSADCGTKELTTTGTVIIPVNSTYCVGILLSSADKGMKLRAMIVVRRTMPLLFLNRTYISIITFILSGHCVVGLTVKG